MPLSITCKLSNFFFQFQRVMAIMTCDTFFLWICYLLIIELEFETQDLFSLRLSVVRQCKNRVSSQVMNPRLLVKCDVIIDCNYFFPKIPNQSWSTKDTGNFWISQWENWPQYTIGILSLVVIAFTLAGCLCCQRQRRPKGFQVHEKFFDTTSVEFRTWIVDGSIPWIQGIVNVKISMVNI